jgi:hypothetical protein
MPKHRPEPLTAAEFFARHLPGFSKTDAQHATKLSYSAIHDSTRDECEPRAKTALALQEWSMGAVKDHAVFISASKTLGVEVARQRPARGTGTEG